MSDILYLKLPKCVQVENESVTLGDLAKMECTDSHIVNKLKTLKVAQIPGGTQTRIVISVMMLVKKIHSIYPALEVTPLGEVDVVAELKSDKHNHPVLQWLKVVSICLILFFGSAFAIMSFNNDVSIEKLFSSLYSQITGTESSGFGPIEWMYSIGIFLGILIFYNHFGGKKVSKDPTPIEVEVRLYEDDINTTLIEGVNRRSEHLDVD